MIVRANERAATQLLLLSRLWLSVPAKISMSESHTESGHDALKMYDDEFRNKVEAKLLTVSKLNENMSKGTKKNEANLEISRLYVAESQRTKCWEVKKLLGISSGTQGVVGPWV